MVDIPDIDDDSSIILTGHGIIQNLKEHGIQYIFGIPDGHTLALYDGLKEIEGIEHILVNDERTAAFAADAYARVSNMLGVCDAGAAGSMNFPVALSEANGAGSPVLAVVGSVKSKDLLRNIPHDIKIAETLKPVTKWAENVTHTENCPRFLNYAIREAVNGRPGSVALVFPEDVLADTKLKREDFIPMNEGSCSINGCSIAPAQSEIDQCVRMIRNSKQPVIFAGGGTVRSGAYAEVRKFAELIQAPVISTILGKGIMKDEPDYGNQYYGTVGLFGERPNHLFLKRKTDLVIAIGNRLTEDDTAQFKFPSQETPMIHIDIDAREIGLNYKALGVIGDPKAALSQIIHQIEEQGVTASGKEELILEERTENLNLLKKAHKKYRRRDNKKWMDAEPIKPQRVLKAIADNMEAEDYLVTDASSSSRWIGAYFPVKSLGRHIITPRGVGPTGFGLGALIGTHFALKQMHSADDMPRIVLFTGDGGLMNGGVSDFETIVKNEINCTIVIINNSALGFVKYGQGTLYKHRFYETDRLTSPFVEIAEAFGGNGITVEKIKDLDMEMQRALNSKGFNLINVLTDPDELLPKNYYV